jgi:CheY-like chemotaxis protein
MDHTKVILLVDDDPDIRDALSVILRSKGYAIKTAANGREAFAILNAEKPDLMVLDIMMTTDIEGFDFAYELKNNPQFESLPIIIMTNFLDKVHESGSDSVRHILDETWPADWFFEKPVDVEKFLLKIDEIVKSP